MVMYLHHNLFPQPEQKEYIHRCNCGRYLFKANTENILVANDIGLGWDKYPPSQSMIEIMCHSCKSRYKILYQ